MFENIMKLFKKTSKKETLNPSSRDTAKERLHLVLMQDRANVSADFLDLMRQEIIEVIKKYIDIDESAMDVRLKNQTNDDGTQGAPALYANIPILNIKDETRARKKESENIDKNKSADIDKDKSEKDNTYKQNNENDVKSQIQREKLKINEDNIKKNNKESQKKSQNNKLLIEDKNEIKTKNEKQTNVKKTQENKTQTNKTQVEQEQTEEIDKLEEKKIAEAKKIVEENDSSSSEANKEIQIKK